MTGAGRVPGAPEFDYLIVGGGLAAVSAVDGIRAVDRSGSILLLSEEAEPPYQRPPLSKEYLRHPGLPRELLHIRPSEWYDADPRLELELRQRALALDPRARRVTTARGNEFAGRNLLLATGGRPREARVPGASREGVLTLRDVGDAEALRDLARPGARAVMIGAGFVGMEIAASLRALGVDCTVVEAEDRVWPRLLPGSLARAVRAEYERRGVRFRLGARLEAFEGAARVTGVRVDGSVLDCDVVVVGVGMSPREELAADAGLAVRDGIQVDAFGETSHAGVFATGDVARHPDPLAEARGGSVRTEHWEHAREHGRRVGRNMAGEKRSYEAVTHFFSEAFDWKLSALGRPAEAERVVLRGTPGAGPSIAFCGRAGRLVGAVLFDAPGALEDCRRLVRAGSWPGPDAALADPDAPLAELAAGPAAKDGRDVGRRGLDASEDREETEDA